MSLPEGFQFSQSNLQDFIECPRRFELRYLIRQAWPALQGEPALEFERRVQQGQTFHRLIQQHLLGVPLERLTAFAQQEELSIWWSNYMGFYMKPDGLHTLVGSGARLETELSLSAPLGKYRLVAKYDLVAISSTGQVFILDWKTSHRRPSRDWLANRVQTRLYPYLLVEAGAHLQEDKPLEPAQVEMIYWFASFPDQPERFEYNLASFRDDQDYLATLIETIQQRDAGSFELTSDEKLCAFCNYRSLCGRGSKAGPVEALDEQEAAPFDLDLDFEQIAEIRF